MTNAKVSGAFIYNGTNKALGLPKCIIEMVNQKSKASFACKLNSGKTY